eukprot:214469_1
MAQQEYKSDAHELALNKRIAELEAEKQKLIEQFVIKKQPNLASKEDKEAPGKDATFSYNTNIKITTSGGLYGFGFTAVFTTASSSASITFKGTASGDWSGGQVTTGSFVATRDLQTLGKLGLTGNFTVQGKPNKYNGVLILHVRSTNFSIGSGSSTPAKGSKGSPTGTLHGQGAFSTTST